MKKILLFILISFAFSYTLEAQPTVLGCKIANSSYKTYDMPMRGVVRAIRIQGGNIGGGTTPIWEFMTGTAASPDYSVNWRPYTASQVLSSYNLMIDPATQSSSARYNTAFGGASGDLPGIVNNNYYTVIVGNEAAANNYMSILETTYNPKTITITRTPAGIVGSNQAVTINVTLSAPLSTGEKVFLRWTNNNDYTTATISEVTNFGGTVNGSIDIPAQPQGTTVSYYVLSSNQASLTNFNADYYTLNVDNNNNTPNNYTYTVSAPVPVILTDVKAYTKNSGIQVEWTFASESNMDRYEVERSSDNIAFNKVGVVTSKGNSSLKTAYSFFDAHPLKGNNFYRINMIGRAGERTLSGVVKVAAGNSLSNVTLYPNPVTSNNISVQLNNLPAGNYVLTITNKAGQLVMKKTLENLSNSSTHQIYFNNILERGSYQYEITGNEARYTGSLIK